MTFSVHRFGGILLSVCPIFGDVKFDHLVKVAFTTDFLVVRMLREDVTLERRREMENWKEECGDQREEAQKGKLWLFIIFPRLCEATRCVLPTLDASRGGGLGLT